MSIIEKQRIIKTWFNEFLTQRNFNILEEIITTYCTFYCTNYGMKTPEIMDMGRFEEFMVKHWLMIPTNRWVINNLIEKEDYIFVEYTQYLTYTEEVVKLVPEGQNIKGTGIMKFHFIDGKIEKLYLEANS
ncbi:TPA: ester cyclase [Bacillus cereus]|uniref:ester cyclase n=1 Tax=Bacillus mycoides TaxID=1405 RepID=UPI0009C7842A|nr:ester cyclase [Bacillus mycoides]OOR58749.1 hypothetical protein BGP34_09850 [Bacillus mycoides]HDX9711787.1 ester cyclase [Bacillus cereus]